MEDVDDPNKKYVQEYEVDFLGEILEETKGLYGGLAYIINFLLQFNNKADILGFVL